jgi:hypothetical protein
VYSYFTHISAVHLVHPINRRGGGLSQYPCTVNQLRGYFSNAICVALVLILVLGLAACGGPPKWVKQVSRAEKAMSPQSQTGSVDGSAHVGGTDKKEVEENRQKEAEEAKRLTELFLRNQSVFIRKGEFMVELNSFYNRNSRTTLVPIGEGVAVAQETRRFFDTAIIGRYGLLTDGLEVDLIVPAFIHAEQVSDFGVVRTSQQEDGFGDIGGALRYQVWYERGARPALVLDVTGKSRTGGTGLTGTGTWNAGGGVTLIKSFDPVVFFGRLGYVYNFASETRDLGNIIDYRVGMGFSLNDRVSFNIQFVGAYIQPSKVEGTGLAPGGAGFGPLVFTPRHVEIMNLIFTTTVMVTKNFTVEPLVGVGLTDESFTLIGLRLPYRF